MCSAMRRDRARNPVWASGTATPPMREASVAESQLVQRRPHGIVPVLARAPRTRSASPEATAAARRGISSGGCCPSPSSVTMMRAPFWSAAAMPVSSAAPFPRLCGWVSTVAPFPRPRSPVPSVEPSSTRYTIAPGAARRLRLTMSVMVAAAWYAGMTTARVSSARPGTGRVSFENGQDRLELRAQVLNRLRRERAARLGLELARSPILLDLLSSPFDRVLLRVQEVLDEHDELDFAPLVHAVPRPVLGGIEKPELTLPVAQHVRLEVGELTHFPDREELLNRMRRAHDPPPPPPHCSGLSSRSIRSTRARCGDFPSNSTAATSRAIGSSTPCRSPSVTAERAVFTPSTTEARLDSASWRRLPRPSSTPSVRLRD